MTKTKTNQYDISEDGNTLTFTVEDDPRAHEIACDLWAAAAGAHGAYAPEAIAAAMTTQDRPDLIAAAMAGTAAALRRHQSEGGDGPKPRGASLVIVGGEATGLVWGTDGHAIQLRRIGGGQNSWVVEIISHANVMRSRRAWAAILSSGNQRYVIRLDNGASVLVPESTESTDRGDPGSVIWSLVGLGRLEQLQRPASVPPLECPSGYDGPLVEVSRRGCG